MHAFNSSSWERKAGRSIWIWSQTNSVRPCLKTTITKIQTNRQNQLSNFYHLPQWQLKHCSSQALYFLPSQEQNRKPGPLTTHVHYTDIPYTSIIYWCRNNLVHCKYVLLALVISVQEGIGQENQTRMLGTRVEWEESPKMQRSSMERTSMR